MPYPKIKLSDDAGNAVAVTDNMLDVNVKGATIATGDIDVNLDAVSDSVEVKQATASNLNATVTQSGTVTVDCNSSDVTIDNASLAVTGTFWQATQPVSGTLTVNTVDVSSLATNARQDTIIGHLDGVEGKLDTIETTNNAIQTAVEGTLTVTANLSATDNAVLDTIDAVLDTIKVDTEAIETAVEAIQSGQLSDGHNVVVTSAPTTAVTIAANVNVDHVINAVGHGVKTVTTAGTDVALAGVTVCRKVDIQAQTDNTGLIAVGGSGVDATESTGTGIILNAGDSYSVEIDDLANIFIDSTVNGEGVRYTYWYK